MKKELIIAKSKKAKLLHAKGWSVRKISRHLVSHRKSVKQWINMKEEEIKIENRGWKKNVCVKIILKQKNELKLSEKN